MEKTTLDHLLQIEAKAAALVSDAQAEADRRIHESEAANHASYEERLKAEILILDDCLKKETEKIKLKYNTSLEEYRKEISAVSIDTEKFSELLDKYIDEEG